jgi:hypothetical protein
MTSLYDMLRNSEERRSVLNLFGRELLRPVEYEDEIVDHYLLRDIYSQVLALSIRANRLSGEKEESGLLFKGMVTLALTNITSVRIDATGSNKTDLERLVSIICSDDGEELTAAALRERLSQYLAAVKSSGVAVGAASSGDSFLHSTSLMAALLSDASDRLEGNSQSERQSAIKALHDRVAPSTASSGSTSLSAIELLDVIASSSSIFS